MYKIISSNDCLNCSFLEIACMIQKKHPYLIDKFFKIHTLSENALGETDRYSAGHIGYDPTDYVNLLKVASYLRQKGVKGKTFVDFGCGLGRVLVIMSKLLIELNAVIGIEYYAGLVELCNDNLKRSGVASDQVYVINEDAARYMADDLDIIYMYEPFTDMVMRSLLQNLEDSLERKPREVMVIYFWGGYSEILKQSPRYKRTETLTPYLEVHFFG